MFLVLFCCVRKKIFIFDRVMMFQRFSGYFPCYPDPAHRKYLRLEVLVIEMPEEYEHDRKQGLVTVHEPEELPYPF